MTRYNKGGFKKKRVICKYYEFIGY